MEGAFVANFACLGCHVFVTGTVMVVEHAKSCG